MMRKLKLRGQSTLEYAILVAVVIGALLAIQIYLKRGVQGKLRESTDQVGEQFDTGKTSVNSNTTRTAKTVQVTNANGEVISSTGVAGSDTPETRTETGHEEVAAF